VGLSLNNLAELYHDQGKYAEADDILARHDDEKRGHAQAFGAHQADEESDELGA